MKEAIIQLNTVNNLNKIIFYFLSFLLLVSSFFYAYFINKTVLNIVDRDDLDSETVMLSSRVSELEFEYIALKNSIDIDYAKSIGFIDTDNVKFASRKLMTKELSFRNN